ncbi:MAG TPA: hypothetical protein VFW62_10435 [bacterium]|nr:hypothetical protein [bacterium]
MQKPAKMDEEVFEGEEVSALPAIRSEDRSEIDLRIQTAHKFPRNITTFRQQALTMATMDEETAESCYYQLPRGGKVIEGPGIRLAEIVNSAWGNMDCCAWVHEVQDHWVVARAYAHDLEKNVRVSFEVRRRITDKYGKRYNEDMILVTANAACAIALRNAIFRVVPKAYVDSIMASAKKVAIGDASTLATRRAKALTFFNSLNVTNERILAFLKKPGLDDIDLKDLEALTGLKTAIKEGSTTVEEVFPVAPAPGAAAGEAPAANKTEATLNKLKATKGTEAAQPPQA